MQNICDRWDDIGNVCSEHELAESTVDEPERRDGISKNENEGQEEKKEASDRKMIIRVKDKSNHGICRESSDRNVQGVIAKRQAVFAALPFNDCFRDRPEYFGQEIHACLRKQDGDQAKPERISAKRFAEIIRDARTEKIGQCGQQEVERMGKAEEVFQFMISN